MELSETQLDLAFKAWALARAGQGIVLEGAAYLDAHKLAELGWLERRFEPDGELSWWWTRQAETALDVSALLTSAEHREN